MDRAGGKRNGEDPPNPFLPDAREVRNQRYSGRTSLTSSQSEPRKKRKFSLPSNRKKTNPNATQHRPISRPAEGRKEIPQTPKKSTKKKWDFIGNQEHFGNTIVFEDTKPFTSNSLFFGLKMNHGYGTTPNCKPAVLTLTSELSWLNKNQNPLSDLENIQAEFVLQCLRRVSKYLPPQEYNILPAAHKEIMTGATNMFTKQIEENEASNSDFYRSEIFTPEGEHYTGKTFLIKKIGNKEFLDIKKRTKWLQAAIIDTDGALLDELFKSQKYILQFRKIITGNGLLRDFFENIHYWSVSDVKYLVAIHANYETCKYGGLKNEVNIVNDELVEETVDNTFKQFGPRLHPMTIGYGFHLPPFFRNNRFEEDQIARITRFLDDEEEIQSMVEKQLRSKMYARIQHEYYRERRDKCVSTTSTYCELVYSSFYASKTDRHLKTSKPIKHFRKISTSERAALYKGDDFIQCYKITKLSNDEIKVERLKI